MTDTHRDDGDFRITAVDVAILDSGIEYGTALGDGEVAGPRHTCLIRVDTASGVSGYADVDSNPWVIKAIVECAAYIPSSSGLRDTVIGQDALDRQALWDRMYAASWYHGRRGAVVHAMSGIDLACWDIAGRATGQSFAELLGGRRHDRIRAYASTLFRPTPGEMRDACRRYLDRGFTAIKFGWGPWGRDPDRDRELLAAARSEVGDDVELMVDGHITGPPSHVSAFVRSLEPLRPRWVEEPIPADRPDQLAELGRSVEVPVATGEQLAGVGEFAELLREPGVGVVQPDISRCGGLTPLSRITALADARGARVVPHAWVSRLHTAATLQANAWLAEPLFVEYNVTTSPIVRNLVPGGLTFKAGFVDVPEGPGAGVDVDPAVVERHRVL